MTVRVAINGFGRTGRQFFRAWWLHHRENFDIVAINGRTPVDMHTHLLKYDSDYGRFPATIENGSDSFKVDGYEVKVFQEDDASKVPWGEADVDIVVDSTGVHRDRKSASQHLRDGVKKVIISAPAKDEDWMVIMGVNHEEYDPASHHIISPGSCTTNCVVPLVKVLHDAFGVERGFMTTIHSYTNDQNLIDRKHKDIRRARAAALNIIPTSTGAAEAATQIMPELQGRLTGLAYRVPTPTVSVVDLVTDLSQPASVGAINEAFQSAASGPMKGFLYVEKEELVSSDFKDHPGSSIFDLPSTMVIDGGKMSKTMSWYDNEFGFSLRMADLCAMIAERGLE
ncbi:MAG: type I glyceraldehyde-3-phosphate dehydrogenase [Dehalococcoidia bacterium]